MAEHKQPESSVAASESSRGRTGAAPGEHTVNAHQGSSTVSLGEAGPVAVHEKKAAAEGSHSSAGMALGALMKAVVPDGAQGEEAMPRRVALGGKMCEMDEDDASKFASAQRPGSSISVVGMNQTPAGEIKPRVALTMTEKDVRAQCRDALQASLNGDDEEAASLAMSLAQAYPQYSFTNTLAAGLCQALGSKIMTTVRFSDTMTDQDVTGGLDVAVKFYNFAKKFYDTAATLAPQCITTAVGRGQALVACQNLSVVYFREDAAVFGHPNFGAAQEELRRAINMSNPDDPALHHVVYDLQSSYSSLSRVRSPLKQRTLVARADARKEQHKFQQMICVQYIPRESDWLWRHIQDQEADAGGRCFRIAEHLLHMYPYCSRVHVLFARVELKRAEIIEKGHMDQVILQLQVKLNVAAKSFPKSLVLANLCAEIAFMLDQYEEAAKLCRRGQDIHNGTDPWEEDVPVHSTQGFDLKDRIKNVKNALQELSAASTAKCAAIASTMKEISSEQATETKNQSGKSNNSTKYAYLYGYSKRKPKDPTQAPFVSNIQALPERVPVTVPVHFVCGEYASQEIVNLFKDYCYTLSKCSTSETACHLCCFEHPWCAKVPKEREAIHYFHKHHSEQKGETIRCGEKECYGRFRSMKEFRQHMYFVHTLAFNWWKTKKTD